MPVSSRRVRSLVAGLVFGLVLPFIPEATAQRLSDLPAKPMPAPRAAAQSRLIPDRPAVQTVTPAPVIRDISIVGVQRLEKETVASYLTLRRGDAADEAKLSDSVRALFATGLFEDVQIAMDAAVLRVVVVENPVVNQVIFEGNSALKTEDLDKEVQI